MESKGKEEIIVGAAVCLLLALFCLRAPFTESFWLDETISAWIVSGTLEDAVRRSISFQGQSPFYYSLLWCVRQVCGGSELALRSLSIACGVGIAVLIYRISLRFTGQRSIAFLAVGALVGCMNFQNALLSARPYALGIFCAALSIVMLDRLRERFSQRGAFFFAASLVGAWYAHYLFALIVLPHAINITRDKALARRLLPWGVLTLAAAAPGLQQWFSIQSRLPQLAFAEIPGIKEIVIGAMPNQF